MEILNEDKNDYFTPKQLAGYLNISLKWVQKHIYSGRLPGVVRLGRSVRIEKSAIEEKLIGGQILLDK